MSNAIWLSGPTIARLAAIYAAIGLFHWALRRRFLTISFQPEVAVAKGWNIRWWDFLFYLSFGLVITFSVPIAGVLLVFSFLVVPAAIAFQYSRRQGVLALISWLAGAVASSSGLLVSFKYDLPTGPVVVCMFGVLLLIAFAARRLVGRTAAVAAPKLPERAVT